MKIDVEHTGVKQYNRVCIGFYDVFGNIEKMRGDFFDPSRDR